MWLKQRVKTKSRGRIVKRDLFNMYQQRFGMSGMNDTHFGIFVNSMYKKKISSFVTSENGRTISYYSGIEVIPIPTVPQTVPEVPDSIGSSEREIQLKKVIMI